MQYELTKCDGCGVEERKFHGSFKLDRTLDWLTVSRQVSGSDKAIQAGVYHLCSDKCLHKWVAFLMHNAKLTGAPEEGPSKL